MSFFTAPQDFCPDFAKGQGLVTVVAQDADNGEVLMLAYMNEEAWKATLATGEAHYYSRSRQKLWHKGESSGNVQKVRSIRLDCDSDAVLLLIDQKGPACHEGYRTCFFRELKGDAVSVCASRLQLPEEMYGRK